MVVGHYPNTFIDEEIFTINTSRSDIRCCDGTGGC